MCYIYFLEQRSQLDNSYSYNTPSQQRLAKDWFSSKKKVTGQ